MPELPEVETVRRQLSPTLVGKKILRVECGKPSYFFLTAPRRLKAELEGKTVRTLERHGKALIAGLSDGSRLLLHLGMTGQLVARALPQDGHVHLVLHLPKDKLVSFRDVRKFGKVEWLAPGKVSKRLDKLGPDALGIEGDELHSALRGRRIAVKSALLNQTVLAGVGNIYADEALFSAGIRPTRAAGKLTKAEVERLATEIRELLARAVKSGGSTINDYLKPDGELGGFQDFHRVYGKGQEPCPICETPITRKVIGGRSSHYCSSCQR